MSKSTAADLAVAFLSFDRRRREALRNVEGTMDAGLLGQLDDHITAAAALVGSPPTAGAIAASLSARPAEDWDEATLDSVRQHATGAGAALRRIAEAAGEEDDDDRS